MTTRTESATVKLCRTERLQSFEAKLWQSVIWTQHCCSRTTQPLWHEIAARSTFPLMIRTQQSKIKQSTCFFDRLLSAFAFLSQGRLRILIKWTARHSFNSSNTTNTPIILPLVKLLVSLRVWRQSTHSAALQSVRFRSFQQLLHHHYSSQQYKSVVKNQNRWFE